ncbi:calcium-binding protein [Nostoc sp.]|uniref:calcium-binding protein n=1 Tax=Nostoc sp. TaxID=1180 RepID=UPI002FFB15B3
MPGTTFTTAQNIGILKYFNYNDAIANASPLDYYKFSLTSTNNITLLLNGVTQNYLYAKIYYDKNNNGLIESGEQLDSEIAGSSQNAQLTTTLGAGNYYVEISQYYNNVTSNYSLQLAATSAPASIASNPGNTLDTAYNIGNLTGNKTFTEFVGSVDPLDYYKFSLTSTNNITLLLNGVTQNYLYAKIYYDKNNNGLIETGDELYSEIAGSGSNAQITKTLGAGNYYVEISQYYNNVNSNYSLQLAATSAPASIASNPGNTLNTAYNIGNLTGTKSFTEFVGSVDPLDYYKFSLTNTSNITLLLNGVTDNYLYAKIYYDKNNNGLIESGEQLDSEIAGSGGNAQITKTLGAGNYYVEISQYNNNDNSNYSLQLANISIPSNQNQRLTGNALNNTLIGGAGNDQLQGVAGNDTLQGGNGNDILTGGTGDDFLWGGLGDDILTGGAGKDKYLFQNNGVFSRSLGVDYITEFEARQDQIVLSKTTFNAVTNTVGQALTNFAVVANDQLVNANNARIIFSRSSGSLFYNQDGNLLGTGTVFEFARLGNPDITLSSSNFSLIA